MKKVGVQLRHLSPSLDLEIVKCGRLEPGGLIEVYADGRKLRLQLGGAINPVQLYFVANIFTTLGSKCITFGDIYRIRLCIEYSQMA